ncbi:hypothetical protein EZV62_007754 [Acer yangbiense]|uniref:Uncharacterized protein n=1 Tax=Acer yangbiense TaxID=1000413 RepID=A0A5C7ICA9_9ROSI|nr:hypothetical protein EZV62_007754 [Acer yangbiense]
MCVDSREREREREIGGEEELKMMWSWWREEELMKGEEELKMMWSWWREEELMKGEEELNDDNIEVAKLSHVCWLDVRGKFKISDLSPGIVYQVVYVVKLTKGASGWELPVTLRLSLPGEEVQDRQVSLLEKPRGEWIELNVGNFLTDGRETRENWSNHSSSLPLFSSPLVHYFIEAVSLPVIL